MIIDYGTHWKVLSARNIHNILKVYITLSRVKADDPPKNL